MFFQDVSEQTGHDVDDDMDVSIDVQEEVQVLKLSKPYNMS